MLAARGKCLRWGHPARFRGFDRTLTGLRKKPWDSPPRLWQVIFPGDGQPIFAPDARRRIVGFYECAKGRQPPMRRIVLFATGC